MGPLREARLKNLGTAEVVFESAEDAFAAYNKYNTRNLDGDYSLKLLFLKIYLFLEEHGNFCNHIIEDMKKQ